MEWYTLRDLVAPFLGERGVVLFSYAISYGNRCLVCSLFFRKILVNWGEDPETPALSGDVALLVTFAGIIAATNFFNTVAKVPRDEIHVGYRTESIKEFEHGR